MKGSWSPGGYTKIIREQLIYVGMTLPGKRGRGASLSTVCLLKLKCKFEIILQDYNYIFFGLK